jgi:cytochrome c-type biogenesis protein CcmH/NrfF
MPHLAVRGRTLSFEPATGLFNAPHSHSAFESGTLRLTAECAEQVPSMVTIHRWTRSLRCPHCGNEGIAALAQSDVSFDVTVESITNSFEAAQGKYGINYRCVSCDIAARK